MVRYSLTVYAASQSTVSMSSFSILSKQKDFMNSKHGEIYSLTVDAASQMTVLMSSFPLSSKQKDSMNVVM